MKIRLNKNFFLIGGLTLIILVSLGIKYFFHMISCLPATETDFYVSPQGLPNLLELGYQPTEDTNRTFTVDLPLGLYRVEEYTTFEPTPNYGANYWNDQINIQSRYILINISTLDSLHIFVTETLSRYRDKGAKNFQFCIEIKQRLEQKIPTLLFELDFPVEDSHLIGSIGYSNRVLMITLGHSDESSRDEVLLSIITLDWSPANARRTLEAVNGSIDD